MNNTGDNIQSRPGNWQFNGDMVEHFDSHINKSVPLYEQGHDLICDLSDFFIHKNSTVYDIGCSTGVLLNKLTQHNNTKNTAQFIGIDVEHDMINHAKKQVKENNNIHYICDDIISFTLEPSDMIICYYSIQFIAPAVRQQVVNKLYDALNWGGALLFFDKMRAPDARFQDIFTTLYNDYKLRAGYKADDIINKTRSLKGVLEPFSTRANINLLKRAGFIDITTIQKHLAFEGILAIK